MIMYIIVVPVNLRGMKVNPFIYPIENNDNLIILPLKEVWD